MELNPKDLKAFLRDLELLSLPPKKKKEILIRSLQMIKRVSVRNTTKQQDPSGKSWKKRKTGTAKMLRRIAKLANSQAENKQGKLFYKNKRTGQIATEHQEGIDHIFKKSDFTGKNKGGSMKEPCTLRQAKKLKDLGYSVSAGVNKKGIKKKRKPSLKEIRTSLSRAKASLIIRKLEERNGKKQGRNLTEWIIPTEKRAFLDTREKENAEIILKIINEFLNKNNNKRK